MPELPETETIARDLDAMVRLATVGETVVHRPDVLRETSAVALNVALRGRTVRRVWRRAKLIVLDFGVGSRLGSQLGSRLDAATGSEAESGPDLAADTPADVLHLVVQPRFTGGLLVNDGTLPTEMLDYLVLSMALADGRALHYRDVRRLGTVALMSASRFTHYSANLGPEPLDPAFSPADLQHAFAATRRPIKAALMDQRRLAGIGNIYATEACWEAGVDPSRTADALRDVEWQALHSALQRILRASIAARGTSFRDYRDARGERGEYVAQLAAYGRAGERCPRCTHRLVGTTAVDGRTTVFCAWCQR